MTSTDMSGICAAQPVVVRHELATTAKSPVASFGKHGENFSSYEVLRNSDVRCV
jgi:hypothetical protein